MDYHFPDLSQGVERIEHHSRGHSAHLIAARESRPERAPCACPRSPTVRNVFCIRQTHARSFSQDCPSSGWHVRGNSDGIILVGWTAKRKLSNAEALFAVRCRSLKKIHSERNGFGSITDRFADDPSKSSLIVFPNTVSGSPTSVIAVVASAVKANSPPALARLRRLVRRQGDDHELFSIRCRVIVTFRSAGGTHSDPHRCMNQLRSKHGLGEHCFLSCFEHWM